MKDLCSNLVSPLLVRFKQEAQQVGATVHGVVDSSRVGVYVRDLAQDKKKKATVKERIFHENDFTNSLHEFNSGKPAILIVEVGAGVGHSRPMSKEQQKDLSVSSIKSPIPLFLVEKRGDRSGRNDREHAKRLKKPLKGWR